MRSWWSIAAVAVVAHCGGSSVRQEESGDGDGSSSGGASGSAGARGGTAGTSTAGATNPSGGRGGSGATTAGGGSGGSSAGDGGDGAISGAAGSDGGAAGAPSCEIELVGGTDCSREETCRMLECGAPWSRFDREGCRRVECTETGTCPSGERCVPAPVLGRYVDACYHEIDGCRLDGDECSCAIYEECFPFAVCVPEDEFPPTRDCPIQDRMDCVGLTRAVETLEAYRDGTEFFFPYDPPEALAASVESCATRLADALQAECD